MKNNFRDIFTKEKFQQEVAEEITKDLGKNSTNSASSNQNSKNRHS